MREKGDGLQWLRTLQFEALRQRVDELEAAVGSEDSQADFRERAAGKLKTGSNLTRVEVAAHLGVQVRTVQRMEAKGLLKRCRGLLGAVRYAARDVLRLAPAPGKEL